MESGGRDSNSLDNQQGLMQSLHLKQWAEVQQVLIRVHIIG